MQKNLRTQGLDFWSRKNRSKVNQPGGYEKKRLKIAWFFQDFSIFFREISWSTTLRLRKVQQKLLNRRNLQLYQALAPSEVSPAETGYKGVEVSSGRLKGRLPGLEHFGSTHWENHILSQNFLVNQCKNPCIISNNMGKHLLDLSLKTHFSLVDHPRSLSSEARKRTSTNRSFHQGNSVGAL